jgi:hypothetical protein
MAEGKKKAEGEIIIKVGDSPEIYDALKMLGEKEEIELKAAYDLGMIKNKVGSIKNAYLDAVNLKQKQNGRYYAFIRGVKYYKKAGKFISDEGAEAKPDDIDGQRQRYELNDGIDPDAFEKEIKDLAAAEEKIERAPVKLKALVKKIEDKEIPINIRPDIMEYLAGVVIVE